MIIVKRAANYIRRKVFTSVIDENGTERLFSVNEEQKEYSAHKRKQNRKIARATQNAEMHANRAAKKADKAHSELMRGNLEQAEALSKSAQKQVRASRISGQQAIDTAKRASKQRTSIKTGKGLTINNQGVGTINVSTKKKAGMVIEKTGSKASREATIRQFHPSTNSLEVWSKYPGRTDFTEYQAKRTLGRVESARELKPKNRPAGNVNKKGVINKVVAGVKKNKKAVIAGTVGAGLVATGAIATKKIHDKKKAEKVFSKVEKKDNLKKAAGHAGMGALQGYLAYDLGKQAIKAKGKGAMGKITAIGAVAGTGSAAYHSYKAGKHVKEATKKDK